MERRHQIARRYLQGSMQSQIARELGVSQQQISYDLKAIRAAWLASLVRDFDEAKATELAKLDLLEHEAWSAWTRSQQPREMTLTEATEGGEIFAPDGTLRPKPPTRKASVRREGQAGDPRFLQVVQKCIDQRCAILGLGEEQAALKAASLGLATLLDQARQARGLASPAAPPLAQA
jgi:transcriptional regulator with XRE-family HTH domain